MQLEKEKPTPSGRRKVELEEAWATAVTMSVLDKHQEMKARLGKDPGRQEVAAELGLKSKSAIQFHIERLIEGGLVEKKRRGVLELTALGVVMLDRFRRRGKV